MTRPKVSVILPTYNRSYIISRAIESVLNQTLKNFELIIVDDGSTDNTEKIVKEYKKQDKRVRYIKHKRNMGANAARNTGIKKSRGKYIAFIDSDAVWRRDKLEKQVNVLRNKGDFVVYTRTLRRYPTFELLVPNDNSKTLTGNVLTEILISNFIDMSSIIVKRKMIKRVGLFDEKLPRLQDWDFLIRLARLYQFVYIPETLVVSYILRDSISIDEYKLLIAEKYITKKYLDFFRKNPPALAQRYFELLMTLTYSLKQTTKDIHDIHEDLLYCQDFVRYLVKFIPYYIYLRSKIIHTAMLIKHIPDIIKILWKCKNCLRRFQS